MIAKNCQESEFWSRVQQHSGERVQCIATAQNCLECEAWEGLSNEQQLPVKCFSSEEARDKNKSEQERVRERESRKNDKNTTII